MSLSLIGVCYDSSSARIGALGGLGEGHFFFEPHPFFFLPELFFAELFLVFLAAVILTPSSSLYLYVH